MKSVLPAFIALITIGAGAFAAEDQLKVSMSSWDSDHDRRVSQDEWRATLDSHRIFDRIDRNNNDAFDTAEAAGELLEYDSAMDRDAGGRIDRDEFTSGLFDRLDANDDGRLDDMEWVEFATSSDGSPLFN